MTHHLGSLLTSNGKGLQLKQFLKQLFAFFMDGTDMSISSFDDKKKDTSYACLLENTVSQMASSHQMKRFFSKISIVSDGVYNKILHELFIWKLKLSKPEIITLGIDTMVMDNNDAKKREGNEVTYKKKKGFQPLHICWGTFLIDVLFRKGSAHSNHGTDFTDRIDAIVRLIRKRYSKDVPIILCADSGFADQKAFDKFEQELEIHYIITSKIYSDIKEYIEQVPDENFGELSKGKLVWKFMDFGNKLKSWSKFRRCILTKLVFDKNGQGLLDFNKTDNLIYTNIGQCEKADNRLIDAGGERYFKATTIVETSHQRGADELIHRSLKELATKEQLPFKKFGMNRAYYFLLVITHFMFQAYKQDVTVDVIAVTVYPNTFRRKFIDFAVKITSGSRYIRLNLNKAVFESLKINEIWLKCQSPPKIQLVA